MKLRGLDLWLALALLAGVLLFATDHLLSAFDTVHESYATIGELSEIDAAMDDLESERRAFAATGDRGQLAEHDRLVARVGDIQASLRAHFATDPTAILGWGGYRF